MLGIGSLAWAKYQRYHYKAVLMLTVMKVTAPLIRYDCSLSVVTW